MTRAWGIAGLVAASSVGCGTPPEVPAPRPVILPIAAAPGDALRCSGPGGVSASWSVDGAVVAAGPSFTAPAVGARVGCTLPDGQRAPERVVREPGRPNLLLVLLDDVGAWDTNHAGLAKKAPKTPHLDALAARGVVLDNAWAAPVCSPTRAGLMTAAYPHHHGVGTGVGGPRPGLPLDADTLPRRLRDAGYRTGVFGKWHLTTERGPLTAPRQLGFDEVFVIWDNLKTGEESYERWSVVAEGGRALPRGDYAPLAVTDAASAFMDSAPEPWFSYVAMPLAHVPTHVPPEELLDVRVRAEPDAWQRFRLMVHAADALIGRMLDALDPDVAARTVVVVLGDNGTAVEVAQPPLDAARVKTTVYEGGVRVPLILAGPGLAAGRRSDALVDHVDVPQTLLELAGVEPLAADGVSLLPLVAATTPAPVREVGFTELFPYHRIPWPRVMGWHRAARDMTHKLVRVGPSVEALYRYRDDPYEQHDLLVQGMTAEDEAHRQALARVLDAAW